MKYYGTKNNKDYGFYLENFENAIKISDEHWTDLLKEQDNGKTIILYENSVIAVDSDEYSFINGKWQKLSPVEIEIKKQEELNKIRINEINKQLEVLDKKRIRAIAEPSLMDEDTSWLEYYNRQVQKLRDELKSITA
ncbi:hypothetical protein J6N69_06620 [bacterium]|nr:hypothetical protein [bacterium]